MRAYGKEAAPQYVVYDLKWSWNGAVFTYTREAGEKNPSRGKRNDWSTTYQIDLAKIEKAESDRPETITLACKYNQSCVQYSDRRDGAETHQGSTNYAYIPIYDQEQRDKLTRAFNHLINLIANSMPKELF